MPKVIHPLSFRPVLVELKNEAEKALGSTDEKNEEVTDSAMDETPEPVYSNLDHELNQEIVTILKNNEGKLYAQHAAWNFCGYIWFKDGKWHEQVWRYHIVVNELSNTDIKSLINEVNSLYGYD